MLRQTDRPGTRHFAGEQHLRLDARDHDFGDARRFLLEHPAQNVLAMEDDRHKQQNADPDAEKDRGLAGAAAAALVDARLRHAQ